MSIDDLWEDIDKLKSEGETNTERFNSLVRIATIYDIDKSKCSFLIEQHYKNFNEKINIL